MNFNATVMKNNENMAWAESKSLALNSTTEKAYSYWVLKVLMVNLVSLMSLSHESHVPRVYITTNSAGTCASFICIQWRL